MDETKIITSQEAVTIAARANAADVERGKLRMELWQAEERAKELEARLAEANRWADTIEENTIRVLTSGCGNEHPHMSLDEFMAQGGGMCGICLTAAKMKAEAQAKAAEKALREVETWFASEEGPICKLWEDCDIGDYDNYQQPWGETLADCRNFNVDPAIVGNGTEWPQVLLYREILTVLRSAESPAEPQCAVCGDKFWVRLIGNARIAELEAIINCIAARVGHPPIASWETGIESVAKAVETRLAYARDREETLDSIMPETLQAFAASEAHHDEHREREAELEAQLTDMRQNWQLAVEREVKLEAQLAEANAIIDANRWPDTAAKLLREADAARLRVALETIAAWPFDILGDCVADARKLAQGVLRPTEQPAECEVNADKERLDFLSCHMTQINLDYRRPKGEAFLYSGKKTLRELIDIEMVKRTAEQPAAARESE